MQVALQLNDTHPSISIAESWWRTFGLEKIMEYRTPSFLLYYSQSITRGVRKSPCGLIWKCFTSPFTSESSFEQMYCSFNFIIPYMNLSLPDYIWHKLCIHGRVEKENRTGLCSSISYVNSWRRCCKGIHKILISFLILFLF